MEDPLINNISLLSDVRPSWLVTVGDCAFSTAQQPLISIHRIRQCAPASYTWFLSSLHASLPPQTSARSIQPTQTHRPRNVNTCARIARIWHCVRRCGPILFRNRYFWRAAYSLIGERTARLLEIDLCGDMFYAREGYFMFNLGYFRTTVTTAAVCL